MWRDLHIDVIFRVGIIAVGEMTGCAFHLVDNRPGLPSRLFSLVRERRSSELVQIDGQPALVILKGVEKTKDWAEAVSALLKTLAIMSPLIEQLPPNLWAKLSKGSVSSDEILVMWRAMRITIRPEAHVYDNGTSRGEANRNGGSPLISFNIDNLAKYAAHGVEGLSYLILHEIGHMTAAGWALNSKLDAERRASGAAALTIDQEIENELHANDVVRAVADYFNQHKLGTLIVLQKPTHGYTDPAVKFA